MSRDSTDIKYMDVSQFQGHCLKIDGKYGSCTSDLNGSNMTKALRELVSWVNASIKLWMVK